MNERPQPHRIAFLLLTTVLPGLAASIAAGALADVQTGLLAGGLAALVSFIIALASESEAARSLTTAGLPPSARKVTDVSPAEDA